MTKYIPPVVRLEDDEELEDVLPQQEDRLESEDMFDQFFSSQGKVLYGMTRYIPPVVRLEDDEELEDVLPQQEDGLESEDMFDQFFSSQGKVLYEMTNYIPLVVRRVRRCITSAGRWIRI